MTHAEGHMMSSDGLDSQERVQTENQEQLALHREYRAGGEGHRLALERLVASLSDVVRRTANKYARYYQVDADDLLQDGLLYGLLPAIESFDETKRVKISTYVNLLVRRMISRRVRRYARQRREFVLSGADGEDDGIRWLLRFDAAGAEAEQREANEKLREVVAHALGRLSRTERLVLQQKYVQGKKDREIAEKLSRTRSRVSQIAETARHKLMADEAIRLIAVELGYNVGSPPKGRGKPCRRMVAVGSQ